MLHAPEIVGQLAFEVQLAPLRLHVPANVGQLPLEVQLAAARLQFPAGSGNWRRWCNSRHSMLHVPAIVGQSVFCTHAVVVWMLHCPGTVAQLALDVQLVPVLMLQ